MISKKDYERYVNVVTIMFVIQSSVYCASAIVHLFQCISFHAFYHLKW